MPEPPRGLPNPSFCAAPGSSRPSGGHASLNPSSTSNSSPQSSVRDLDSDTNSSPINDISSLLFGLPSMRPGVWSNF